MFRNCIKIQSINKLMKLVKKIKTTCGTNEMNDNLWYLPNEARFHRLEGAYEHSYILTLSFHI